MRGEVVKQMPTEPRQQVEGRVSKDLAGLKMENFDFLLENPSRFAPPTKTGPAKSRAPGDDVTTLSVAGRRLERLSEAN